MKICYLQPPIPRPDLAGYAWCRALGGDSLDTTGWALLDGSTNGDCGLDYDIVLLDVTATSLEVPGTVRRLLGSNSSAILVLFVAHSLPNEFQAIQNWKSALSQGDVVLASHHSICLDILSKTGLTAYELLPPEGDAADLAPDPGNSRGTVTVVAGANYSHRDLIREIGLPVYLWIRIRYRLVIESPAVPAGRLLKLVRQSSFVYLPESIEDGGTLAAGCANSGAILIANRAYDPAKFTFPFTTFGPGDRKRRRALLFLWLHGSRESAAFIRENARRAAEQLRDENSRVRIIRKVQYRFPVPEDVPKPDAPPTLMEQIRHRCGKLSIEYAEDECLVVCPVQNGQEHIPAFLEHYRALGVSHFVFIDNGSHDATLSLLESEADVTVYETKLPFKWYQTEIRRLVIEKHCRNRFCLNVDIDELFDYPMSDRLSLPGLLGYLRGRGATAMAGYMLDMYNKENSFGSEAPLDLKSSYPYYDISNITKLAYHTEISAAHCDYNTLLADHVKTYIGGIRNTVFGGHYLLTKHPLICLDGTLDPVTHPHYSNKAKIADVTCVLYHYKFTPSFQTKVEESCASRRHVKFAQVQYDRYRARIEKKRALRIDTPGTRRLRGTGELVEQGFLATSPAFETYVRSGIS